tara:strand:+ start:352 stop:753 length:402 start_codon:yes stop_codon:yes gene_type:complete
MANGTIAFDTLSTSGQIDGTARSVDTDYLVHGGNKQWCNVNGVNATINDSFNVSSASDEAVGKKQIVATNSMANTSYSVVSATYFGTGTGNGMHPFIETTFTTGEFRINTLEYNSTNAGDCIAHFTQNAGELA